MSSCIANECIAHIRTRDGTIQSLAEHLQVVSRLSQKFASKIKLSQSGKLIGLMHDLGKYSSEFQRYILGVNGMLGGEEKARADLRVRKIDHATAGAQEIWKSFRTDSSPLVSQLLAACIASHHSGLYDFVSQDGNSPFLKRIEKSKEQTFLEEALAHCDTTIRELYELVSTGSIVDEVDQARRCIRQHEDTKRLSSFHEGLLLRFLFSCLIDADRLNTANFENPDAEKFRNTDVMTNWGSLKCILEDHLTTFKSKNRVDELRSGISNQCVGASSRPKGVFSLTVPTGGGKTLASLRFAIHHALHHSSSAASSSIERIIYVIPYTSIIEQNAETVRNIFGDNNILEHHSNIIPGNDTWRSRVLSENWDAPIVFTTSVQFLNALFGASTRDIRRMHQLANAIIIFDEVQTIPIKTIHLFNNAINFLIQMCGSSVVLCTATQPLLDKVKKEFGAIRFRADSAIIADSDLLFQKLRRTEIKDCRKPVGWSVQEVADVAVQRATENGSALIIVNTKKSAQALYNELRSNEHIQIYHLSTNMCPAHRKDVLNTIRAELRRTTQPIICISTQLIEAGVDIDFGSVIRYLAGLDSIAQAAGRCNRHGHRTSGPAPVFVINPAKEYVDNLPDIQKGQEHTCRILDEFKENPEAMGDDLLSPQAMSRFYTYYFFDRADEMRYRLSPKNHPKIESDTDLLDLLSLNKNSVEAYRRTKKSAPPLVLCQAFATAYNAFSVIDAPTEGIIVPYGEEGKEIINELVSVFSRHDCPIDIQKRLLRRAQQYSVNVFPGRLQTLHRDGCIHEVLKDSAIFYLDERHYNDNTGITLEETMEMSFLNV